MSPFPRTIAASIIALALVATACGGDDDTETTSASSAPSATEAPASGDSTGSASADGGNGDVDTSDPNGEQALGGDPAGSAVMTVGDVTIEGDIVECTLVEPDVQFIAQGETAQIEIASAGGGAVSVMVTGAYEFEGNGTAAYGDGTAIDSGDVTITGSGAQPDDSAPIEDFTINATISSC